MPQFHIGEIARLEPYDKADWHDSKSDRYFGTDVTVDSLPTHSLDYVGGVGYWIRTFDGRRFDVGAVCLRKKRPPQDWVRFCRLDDIPVEETV
jgi:hypothetical protein